MLNKSINIEETVLNYLDKGLDGVEFKEDLKKLLKRPDREVKMDIPVKMDDRTFDTFFAYRVQHSDLMGPYKGGLRLSPLASEVEFRALALLMTLKLSLFEIPFGGAKGGIKVDIKKLSKGEKRRLLKKYIEELDCLIGSGEDIPAPDMGTGPEEMSLISEILHERNKSGVHVTGKPVKSGGIKFRQIATGAGVAYALNLAHRKFFENKKELDVAIQGFGNVGAVTAQYLTKNKYKVIAVSDKSGGVYNDEGLPINVLKGLYSKYDNFNEMSENQKGFSFISNDSLLKLEVDALIPAAVENVVTEDNADKLNSLLIIEGANAPVSINASEILVRKGITVIPDIFANAGGVIGSFFEWERKKEGTEESTSELRSRLYNMMDNVWSKISKNKLNIRSEAYKIALNNISDRYQNRGYKLAN